jgi:hypothetical protein
MIDEVKAPAPKVIKGKIAWGFVLDKQAYGSEVDLDIEIRSKDAQARREIKGRINSFMAMLTKQFNYSLQKLVTGKTEIEDEIENLNKLFAEKTKGVKK